MAHSPHLLTLVRHAESEGNAAHDRAHSAGAEIIDVDPDDRAVSLTPVGIRQARALGVALAADPPSLIYSSPHRRTVETARIAASQWSTDVPIVRSEALRERSLGILNRLTGAGIRARYPDEAQTRARVGKFSYRPPDGESWEDVAERLRPFIRELRETSERHTLVVTHQVVIFCLRYLLESMNVDELMDVDASTDVANCSLTQYRVVDGTFELERFNDTSALRELGTPVTHGNDAANPG